MVPIAPSYLNSGAGPEALCCCCLPRESPICDESSPLLSCPSAPRTYNKAPPPPNKDAPPLLPIKLYAPGQIHEPRDFCLLTYIEFLDFTYPLFLLPDTGVAAVIASLRSASRRFGQLSLTQADSPFDSSSHCAFTLALIISFALYKSSFKLLPLSISPVHIINRRLFSFPLAPPRPSNQLSPS